MRTVFPGPVTVPTTLERDWEGKPQRQEMREQVECSLRSGGRVRAMCEKRSCVQEGFG